MGRFKDILSAISPFGILITAFSVGFGVASLIWLLMHFYPTQEKITEYKNKNILLEQDNEKMKRSFNQGDSKIVYFENIIKKQEDEINSCKKALNSKIIDNDQLKNKLSKIEIENKQLKQQPKDIRVIGNKEKKIIEDDKKDVPLARTPEPILKNYEQQRRKTILPISVLEHGTTDIMDGTFFITLNKCGRSGVDAVIRARGYPDLKIEKGQAGQDFIFRCAKNYEIRIKDIGVNSNVPWFLIREIE